MRNRLILAVAIAAWSTASTAAPAASYSEFGLYNLHYYDANGVEVGFRAGICTYTHVVPGTLIGEQTADAREQYVGVCIDGVPYYY